MRIWEVIDKYLSSNIYKNKSIIFFYYHFLEFYLLDCTILILFSTSYLTILLDCYFEKKNCGFTINIPRCLLSNQRGEFVLILLTSLMCQNRGWLEFSIFHLIPSTISTILWVYIVYSCWEFLLINRIVILFTLVLLI